MWQNNPITTGIVKLSRYLNMVSNKSRSYGISNFTCMLSCAGWTFQSAPLLSYLIFFVFTSYEKKTILFHEVILLFIPCHRNYSQPEYKKAIVYSSLFHRTFPSCIAFTVYGCVFSMTWYKIVMQSFLVINHGISHLSLVFSLHTHEPWDELYIRRKFTWRVGYPMIHLSKALHNWYAAIQLNLISMYDSL